MNFDRLPSIIGKLAINATNAGGVTFKISLGAFGVPPLITETLGVGKVLETAGTPDADGPEGKEKSSSHS